MEFCISYNAKMSLQQNDVGYFITLILCFIAFILIIITYIISFLRKRKIWPKKHIPGPYKFPIIGTILQIGLNTPKSFQRFRKQYGDIFSVSIGSQEVVVISGLKLIQEALNGKETTFAGRPDMYTFQFLSEAKSLSFNKFSDQWKQHKKLAESAMRRIMDKGAFVNTVVSHEAQCLVQKLLPLVNKPVDPLDHVLWSVGHVMYDMCFGDSRSEIEDFEIIIRETVYLVELHNTTNSGNILNFFPSLRKIMWWKSRNIENLCKHMCGLAKQKEREHLQTFQPDNIRNATDALILACKRSSTAVDYDQILHTTQDFIGAGLDILYVTLTWAILYLAEYPLIQQRIKAEISSNISCERSPKEEDAKLLPYTLAFIFEVMRHSSVVPFAIPHSNLHDTHLAGYFLPKDTFIMVDLHSVHKDPVLWEEPEKFNPERFMDDKGCFNSSAEKFIPFGIGRRRCVGDRLAKQIMFIYISTLLQSYHIKKPAHIRNYDLTPSGGLLLKPTPFQVIFSLDR